MGLIQAKTITFYNSLTHICSCFKHKPKLKNKTLYNFASQANVF